MPDGVVQLTISLDDHDRILMTGNSPSTLSLKNAWVTGVQKQHVTYQLQSDEITLCVRFVPGGFYALTGIPLAEVNDQAIYADLVFGKSILYLRERIAGCTNVDAMFLAVEQYFLPHITKPASEYAIVNYICDNISDTPLQKLVQKTGYSQKHVIHLFKRNLGISPKYFQRIIRFNKALRDIVATTSAIDWWDIVFNHGYFDQPHFVKEFHHFAGISPGNYIDTGSACTRFIHLNHFR